jgi:DNA-binding LytR/AlgR family response regulator
MYQLAVCDDNVNALGHIREALAAMLPQAGCPAEIHLYHDGAALLGDVAGGKRYDAVFLDIQMPPVNGIELAKRLRSLDPAFLLVFVSSHERYVFEAFQACPLRFVRKRRFLEDARELMPELARRLKEPAGGVVLTAHNKVYRIDVARTLYVESRDKTLDIVYGAEAGGAAGGAANGAAGRAASGAAMQIRYKISDLEKLLAPHGFARIHKSYLVNLRHVFCIRNGVAQLDNGAELPVSRSNVDGAKAALLKAMMRWP